MEDDEYYSDDESSIEISEDSTIHRRRDDLEMRLRNEFNRPHQNRRRIEQIQDEIDELRREIQRRARNADVRRKGGMSKSEIENLPSVKYVYDGRNK